jgi:hypothetical protein
MLASDGNGANLIGVSWNVTESRGGAICARDGGDSMTEMCDIALLWAWWEARNKVNVGEKRLSISDITRRIQLLLIDLKVNPTNDDNTTCRGNKWWSPPPPDILKVNIDGAFWEKEKHGAWGFVIQSHDGQAVMVGADRLEHVHDALNAEMYACLETLKACSDQGMMRVIIESNCATLVSTMKKSGYELSPIRES